MVRRALSKRPSASMAVALTALFVALGGSAVAATLISGSRLKNRSVSGAKIKKDGLGGTEIKESKLGKVPKSATADNSAAVGGMTLRRFTFQAGASSAPKTVVDLRGLTLRASCNASTSPVFTAVNTTPSGKSEIDGFLQSGASSSNPRNVSWSPGDTLPIISDGSAFKTGIGTVVFARQDGQGNVTVNFNYDNTPAFGSPDVCEIAGTVIG